MQEQMHRQKKVGRPSVDGGEGISPRATVRFDPEMYDWLRSHPDGLQEVVRQAVRERREQAALAS